MKDNPKQKIDIEVSDVEDRKFADSPELRNKKRDKDPSFRLSL